MLEISGVLHARVQAEALHAFRSAHETGPTGRKA